MLSTSIVKRVLDGARIAIPTEFFKMLDVKKHQEVIFYSDDSSIIVEKNNPVCILCKKDNANLFQFKERNICTDCAKELIKIEKRLSKH